MSTIGRGPSFLKWQVALGLGAVGALGLAYWYLRAPPRAANLQPDLGVEDKKADAKVEETDFQRAQRYKTEGNEMFKRGRYDEAISLYNQAIEAIPEEYKTDLATYYQNRAAAYEHLKKWSSVIADCTKAIELNNRYEKALYRRAKAEEIVKDWENALDDITSVCILQNFSNQSALIMADRVLKELGKRNAQEAIKTREPKMPSPNFIKTYFSSFSQDPVHRRLTRESSVEEDGDARTPVGYARAIDSFRAEQWEEIIPACTEEINLSEAEAQNKLEALSLRASFYFLRGQFSEAALDLDDIISCADQPDVDVSVIVNALVKRASIYMQTERLAQCLEDFEAAAEKGDTVADVFFHRGQVKLLLERTDEARKDFQKAVELNPDFPLAFVQRCYTDYRHALQSANMEALADSLEAFERAVQKFPTCVDSYVLYAQVRAERQEWDAADQLYKRALHVDPATASTHVHRGLLLLQWKGDTDGAVRLMREALKADDRCEFAYETLGTVEVQRGNFVLAIDLFNRAIRLARSEQELVHLFSLRDAAQSQLKIAARLGIGGQQLGAVA